MGQLLVALAGGQAAKGFRPGERKVPSRAPRRGVEAPRLVLDYVNAADPDTLEPLTAPSDKVLLSLAAKLGSTRLIDNVVLG